MSKPLTRNTNAESYYCLECGWYAHDNVARTCYEGKRHIWVKITCVEAGPTEGEPTCSGAPVEYRRSYGLKRATLRCKGHHDVYLRRMGRVTRRREHPDSSVPPADFNPTYAGESWDED